MHRFASPRLVEADFKLGHGLSDGQAEERIVIFVGAEDLLAVQNRHHTPTADGNPPSVLVGKIDNLLDTVHVGSKCSDNQTAVHVFGK